VNDCGKFVKEVQVMRRLVLLALLGGLAGCNPYIAATTVVRETYGTATDLRSVSTQESDTKIEAQLKAALLASPVKGTSGIDVFCRQGIVLLAGVVPSGSAAGQEAVKVARETAGVKRVETYFVSARAVLDGRLRNQGTDPRPSGRRPLVDLRPG
jgi:osmotically-inducible protein OsmY